MTTEQIKQAIKQHPKLNNTELAQLLAPDWKHNRAKGSDYSNILLKINKLKAGYKYYAN